MPTGIYKRIDAEERFWPKIDRSSDCWLWRASINNQGYGRFRYWGGELAHRYSYEKFKGTIPEGLTIDHMCRVRRCVNPAHLQTMSLSDNCRLGSPAQNTHCPAGHAFEGRNVVWNTDSKGRMSRTCRTCSLSNNRKRWPLKKDAYNASRRAAWRKKHPL